MRQGSRPSSEQGLASAVNLAGAFDHEFTQTPLYDMETYGRDTTKSGPRFTDPIGLDGLYRKGELTDYGFDGRIGGFPRVNAVKGTWQDDHTFVIDRLILGQGRPAERWTLTFDGEKLNVRVKLGDGDEISMDSETGG